jgi:hypothetical protein
MWRIFIASVTFSGHLLKNGRLRWNFLFSCGHNNTPPIFYIKETDMDSLPGEES